MVKNLIQLGANVHASMKVIVRSINFSKEKYMRNSNERNDLTLSGNVNLVISNVIAFKQFIRLDLFATFLSLLINYNLFAICVPKLSMYNAYWKMSMPNTRLAGTDMLISFFIKCKK